MDLLAIARTSQALKWKSDRKGSSAYPARFEGKVPLKIRMNKTVNSSFVFLEKKLKAFYSQEYYCHVNSFGAVSAILEDGEKLGVKPDEFQVIEWH